MKKLLILIFSISFLASTNALAVRINIGGGSSNNSSSGSYSFASKTGDTLSNKNAKGTSELGSPLQKKK